MIGQTIGNYHIEQVIGAGGQATLYRATNQMLDRPTAIKVLHPHLTRDAKFRQKFAAESRLLARLTHPNIVKVYDAGYTNGHYWIAMEWLGGQTIYELLEQDRKLDPSLAINLATQVADALVYAHQHNIIHRDVKPDNIMVLPNQRVKLLDFGIAAVLENGDLANTNIGTPAYMSWEQVNGKAEARSDLYSLGATLYHMLTGDVPPRFGQRPARSMRTSLPSVSEPIDNLTLALLQRDVEKRPKSAEFVLKALKGEVTVKRRRQPRPTQTARSLRQTAQQKQKGGHALKITYEAQIASTVTSTFLGLRRAKYSDLTFKWAPNGKSLFYKMSDEQKTYVYEATVTDTNAQGASLWAVEPYREWSNVNDFVFQYGYIAQRLAGFKGDTQHTQSPDGKWSVEVIAPEVIQIVNAEYGRRLIHARDYGCYYFKDILGWSRNSDFIVCRALEVTGPISYLPDVVFISIPELKLIQPTPIQGSQSGFAWQWEWCQDLNAFVMNYIPKYDGETQYDKRHLILANMEGKFRELPTMIDETTTAPKRQSIVSLRTQVGVRRVLCEVSDGTIWSVPFAGSSAQLLTHGRSPKWSLDGKAIAFLRSSRMGGEALWVAGVEEVKDG